ncbi:unnamed protein product, partial [Rotaria socialis]
ARELQRRQQREMLNHLFADSDTIESDDEINPDSQSAEREPIKLSPSIPSCLPSHETWTTVGHYLMVALLLSRKPCINFALSSPISI